MKRPTFSRVTISVSLLFLGLLSYAQNYEPFTPRFDQDLKGDIVLIGNNILGPDNNAFNDSSVYNHMVDMTYIDIDGDPTTFSSSSADLEIPNPNCYKIIYAGLYWGAVNPGAEPITNVKFKGPTGGYNDINGTIIYDANGTTVDGGDSFSYACFADVTAIVDGFGGSDLGTYTVANVSSAEGQTSNFIPYNGTGQSAGWSLFIVYEDPTLPGKSITSFDGFSAISVPGNNPTLDIPVDGFRTIPAPAPVRANFAFATLEGDSPILGDRLRLNGVSLSTVDRPVTNFFNSSVTQLSATPVNNRVPNSINTLGFDTGVMAVPNPGNSVIANDATSGTIRLETSGDTYFPYFFAFAVEIIEPNIVLTKIVEDETGTDIGGQTVDLGATLNYVIGFQNTGNDNATNFQIRDILPINIVFNYPADLVLPPGVTVASYDPITREIIFNIDNSLVEENDPVYEIRIEVQVVDDCGELADACSNIINNQAFATYNGFYNPTFQITDDPSINSNTGCLLSPQTTNFLADLDCEFLEDIVLCGDSVELTAANGYDSYSWSTSPTGTPVIGNTQTITVTATGTYYSFNNAVAPCQSIEQVYEVELFGGDIQNPVIPYADEIVTCPNDGKLLPNIFLCGADDTRNIETNIASATSIIWEQLDEPSCPAVTDPDCANEDASCTWNEVANGSDFLVDTSGQFRLTINYSGGCFQQFYFNVYQNVLAPSVVSTDIICATPGSITVLDVPSGYEYSLDNTNYQSSNVFSVNTAGTYTVYIRQVDVPTNPCIFTVLDVLIRDRDFTATPTILQPLCHGDKGSIQLAANDVDPQYSFALHSGGTLVNSVGPIVENTYIFENLNPGTYTVSVETENGCTFSEVVEIIEPPLLTVTAAVTVPLTCNDGEITVYPQGGTPPYFYFVNGSTDFQTVPEIVVTTAGVYEITVLDSNNCSANTTISVDPIEAPEFTIDTTDIACAGGNTGVITINVTATNGNSLQYSIDGGMTFVNSNVFTGLAEDDYDVVIQYSLGDSECDSVAQTVSIVAANAISGTAELTGDFTCTSNGSITVTNVLGGDAPFSYSIDGVNFQTSDTFNNLTAGTYTITIKDANDCTSVTNDVTIEPLDPPTDLTFENSPITCPSNTSTVTITSATGGTGVLEYQIIAPVANATVYQTSNEFTGLEPGTYTFQVRDENECVYSESYTIDPIPTPTVNVVLTSDLNCTVSPDAIISGTITGTAPYTYAVSFDGSAYNSQGATGNTFTYAASTPGTYQFEITDANGCIAESSVITVDPISLPELTVISQTQDILCNGDSNGAIDITIDTSVGTPPFTINVNNDTTGTDFGSQTSGLTAGTYTITVTDANSCEASDTIIINEPDPIVLDYTTIDITCGAGGVSQGSVIINSVIGGTAPYTYYVTGTNGYSNTETNLTGSTSVNFDVVDFGLYEINIIDANGCSLLTQDVLVASPPSDLVISVDASVDCLAGGEAVVSVGSTLPSSGPFFFSIYQGPISIYPDPPGSWIPEDVPGGQSATFSGLTSGVTYTFIVFDASTNCSYYEPSTTPIPTNSTLTATAVSSNNISCTGSDDGNVSFTINSIYGSDITVDYEIFNSLSLNSTGVTGIGTVPANGSLSVTDLGPLPFGNYFVSITETSGPNAGCGVVTIPFNITESAIPLELSVSVDQNANCNANSGQISAVAQNGTAPYQYQITTSATAPLATDSNWVAASVFNSDAGNYYVHVLDAYGCVVSSPVVILPMDDAPEISASLNDQCTTTEGEFAIDVALVSAGIEPYSYSIDGGAFQSQTVPFTISNLFSGTHTIEIQDVNGCGNIVTIDIAPPLGITAEVTTMTTCSDDDGEITVTPDGGSGTFTYSINPNPVSVSLTGNVFSGVPSGLYTITITDTVTSCTEDVTISVPEATPLTFTTTATALTCFGDNSGSFEMDISGYSGAYTYEVFNNSGASVTGVVNSNTSTNPQIVTGLTAGSFSVVINETEIPFCSATSNVIISSPSEALTLTATETSNVTCDDSQGTITAVATGGWGDFEYELTGDATVAFSPEGTFTDLSAGNYTVNVIDAEGCTASVNITLVAPNPIDATFTPSTSVLACFGDQDASITVNNVTGGQTTEYIYTLNTILPTPSTSGPQTTNVFDNLGAGTYTVTISDSYECVLTSVDIVITEPTPIVASLVTSTTQTCEIDAALTLSASGGTGTYSYSNDSSFSTILGSFTSSTTFDVIPGTYQYYVRDANGCVANVSNEITIEELPELIVNLYSNDPTINCAGDNTGSIIAEAEGGLGNYVYTLEDTSGNAIAATQNSPGIFTELVAGTYMVIVESGDCDEAIGPITITEPSAPLEVEYNVNNVTCTGNDDGVLEIIATGGTGIIKYAISPQLNQFFETSIFENLASGDYTVIVQDELGCYVTFDFTIADPEQIILTIVPDSMYEETCAGDSNAEFSIEISGGNLPYSVSLDDYDGPYTTGASGQTGFDFTDLSGGDHIVYVRDDQGCESQWNISFPEPVTINPTITMEYTCENNQQINAVTVLVDESITDLSQLDYSLNGGPYQTSNIFTDITPGVDHYIDVRHTNGCIQTTELFTIDAFEPVAVSLSQGDEQGEIVAIATGGTGIYQFTLNEENYGTETSYIIYEEGVYTVVVVDSNGCRAEASMELELLGPCIPNYFTPNGDGVTDTWSPGCSEDFPNLTFDIFDRYGRKVATYRVGEYWDGRYNGTELPTGDYWYVVYPNNPTVNSEYVGHFTLYR